MKKPDSNRAAAGVNKARDNGLVTVLHVDDDPNDTELLQAACQKGGVGFRLVNVEDGEQAISYLTRLEEGGGKGHGSRPVLVLLDLKMPRTTGFEILRWIRRHPTLHRLPIIVLSGSEMQEDIRQAYAQGANSYLVKPLGFEALVKLVKNLNAVWVTSTFEMLGR